MPVAMPEQHTPSTSSRVRPASSRASRIIAASSTRPRVSSSPVGDAASATLTSAAAPLSDRPIRPVRLFLQEWRFRSPALAVTGAYRPSRRTGSEQGTYVVTMNQERLAIDASTSVDECVALTEAWVEDHVPVAWRDAAARGGNAAIREVRGRAEYEAWYPVFGASGLVMPTWAPEYGGLGVAPEAAAAMRAVLSPYNLRALNPLGLNNTAAALFAYGTEEQKRRFLGPIVRNEEKWCQLFSEPGAGSDLASLATRAVLDGDEWIVTGQKVWTTWGSEADFAILLARTDPTQPKNKGITYFLIDMHEPGVDVRPLRHISGEVEFNEVFLDQARVPDFQRLGDVNDGWRVAGATLSSERQMVAGAGTGGSGRVGGSGVDRLITLARARGIGD